MMPESHHDSRTLVRELHVVFKIPYMEYYITKIRRKQAEVILNSLNPNESTELRSSAYLETPTSPLVEEGTLFQNTEVALERAKIWSWVPRGPETKNGYVGNASRNLPNPIDKLFGCRPPRTGAVENGDSRKTPHH
jgi:hypothetical protein